ncbi:SpoIIE family protein phosphatase, partial [Nocardioides sp.]|uniref:SpoIIE family protein phosphatase n=1 Tax=Nocardioides sp. TaxID=35761 RepID=UPI002B265F27
MGDAPAGVLLVDLESRSVIHANAVAEQLAPGTRMPMPLEDWSDAAELRDLDGNELSDTDHPLSRVARSAPVAGQAVSAGRASDLGGRRSALWVVALPLEGAPGLDDQALVVLLPLSDPRVREAATALVEESATDSADLYGRAVRATSLSFTVADATAPGQPLVWVNPAFTHTTGYEVDEVVGRNCRFLQGPATGPTGPRQMREAISRGEACRVILLNYRKDGTPFWNQVDLSPVHDGAGEVTHFVGIQTDVTLRVDAERAVTQALRSETRARADAEAARARLAFLVEAVNQLSGTLDAELCAQRLLELVTPELCDWALLLHLGDHGELVGVRALHSDPAHQPDVADYATSLLTAFRPGSLVDVLLQGQQLRVIERLGSQENLPERSGYLRDMSVTEETARLGSASALCVGLSGRGTVREILALVRNTDRPAFGAEDIDVGRDLGHRAGLVLDNARLYQAQRLIAETLQHSLLSDLPPVDGLDVAARYHVGDQAAQVGGDFYELLALDDGSVGVAIGDVLGHDVFATAAMGHLKGMLRALAHTTDPVVGQPGRLLDDLDGLISRLRIDTIATAVYARLRRVDGNWHLDWANAGHPPPVLRLPDGTTEVLSDGEPDLLLGAGAAVRATHSRVLPAGSTL